MSVWPYLTTVNQPIDEMAHAAAMMLLDRSVDAEPQQRELDFRLIERGSVGAVK